MPKNPKCEILLNTFGVKDTRDIGKSAEWTALATVAEFDPNSAYFVDEGLLAVIISDGVLWFDPARSLLCIRSCMTHRGTSTLPVQS